MLQFSSNRIIIHNMQVIDKCFVSGVLVLTTLNLLFYPQIVCRSNKANIEHPRVVNEESDDLSDIRIERKNSVNGWTIWEKDLKQRS